MKRNKYAPLLSLLDIPLWGLGAFAIITGEEAYIAAFLVWFGAIVITLITVKVKASNKKKSEQIRIWRDGEAGTAHIVSIGEDGSGLNNHPYIDFVFSVSVGDREAYRASAKILISRLAIPRVQPGCEVEVRVDQDDPQKVLVDPKLTPYPHYGREKNQGLT